MERNNITHYVNHFGLFVDGSDSMRIHASNVVKVADNQVAFLAQRSRELGQETRISLYSFSGRAQIYNLVWDMDVLRMPSIKDLYKTKSMTALMDATHKVIDDFKTIPTMYDDHAIYLLGISDGYENDSKNNLPGNLKSKIDSLPENWTIGLFVPDINSKAEAKRFGFSEGNIELWDTSKSFTTEVGESLRKSAETFMTGRTQGIRGYNAKSGKSLFTFNTVSVADITKTLKQLPIDTHSYTVDSRYLNSDGKVDIMKLGMMINGKHYRAGDWFYEHNKTEIIQASKNVVLMANNRFWYGDMKTARGLLGLPDENVSVKPGVYNGYTLFVQTKSINRVLRAGDRVLYLPALNV